MLWKKFKYFLFFFFYFIVVIRWYLDPVSWFKNSRLFRTSNPNTISSSNDIMYPLLLYILRCFMLYNHITNGIYLFFFSLGVSSMYIDIQSFFYSLVLLLSIIIILISSCILFETKNQSSLRFLFRLFRDKQTHTEILK